MSARTPTALLLASLAGLAGCQVLDEPSSQPQGRAAGWSPPGSSSGSTAPAGDAGNAVDAGGTPEASTPAPATDAATAVDAGAPTVVDADLPDLRPAVQVAAGYEHTCALTKAGSVWCWGANDHGQLGDGSGQASLVALPVAGLDGAAIALSSGADHACAVVSALAGDYVECWGRNDHGQVGDGSTTDRPSAVRVAGLPSGVSAVSAGGLHSCALAAGGVWCWGDDADGQLGDGQTQDRAVPVQVSGVSGATLVAAGGAHTCAAVAGGVTCWGFGADGQLGNGGDTSSGTPHAVQGLSATPTCVCAGNAHTCALVAGGAACWGYGQFGQLGDGTSVDQTAPSAVQSLPAGATTMAAGAEHVCALDGSGGAWCWGEDESGQLGNGGASDSALPVSVQGIASGASWIAAGQAHSCAVVGGGGIRCWGWNVAGQLGDGSSTDSATPVEVAGF